MKTKFVLSCTVFLAVILVLTGCAEIQKIIDELKQPPSVIALQLQPLSQEVKPFLEPGRPNCAIDDFDIPGEGYKFSGMSGGIGVAGSSLPVDAQITDHDQSVANFKTVVDMDDLAQETAIIILDDFNGNVTAAKPSVFSLSDEVFKLEGLPLPADLAARASQLDIATATLEANGDLSHGAMVMNHALSLLSNLEETRDLDGDYSKLKSDGLVTYYTPKQKRLIVQGVDTEDLDTSVITTRLSAAMADMRNNKKIGRIVVNMSFAIVPCGVANDFAASKATYPDFESYAKALADANKAALQGAYTEAEFLEIITELIGTPLNGDPLISFFREQKEISGAQSQAFIASSGNYGLPYSMYLGALDNVVSVSASDANDPTSKINFSNKGEVMDVGAWYRLKDATRSFDIGKSEVIYAGTSYSAPNVSVYQALDMMQSTPKCSVNGSSDSKLIQPAFDDKFLLDVVSGC